MNYITTLPNFTKMQRTSFWWFIAQGLEEELSHFSKIYDFSYNTQYLIFGHEYKLVKPIYSLIGAKKYGENYAIHLLIPLQIRNKTSNLIRYEKHFPIIKLPLMTTMATFITNGCERIIVSQIIRSPGIYFEKNKNQQLKKKKSSKIIAPIYKLDHFFPSGQPWKCNLTINSSFYNHKLKNFTTLSTSSIQTKIKYSLSKIIHNKTEFYFIILFKIFRIISKLKKISLKKKQIHFFFNRFILLRLNKENFKYFLNYWNFLTKILLKFNNYLLNSRENRNKLYDIINWIINIIQLKTQIKLRDKLFLICFLHSINNCNLFKISKQFSKNQLKKILINLKTEKKFKLFFYFSTSLEFSFKYQLQKQKQIKKLPKYFKSNSKILLFKKNSKIYDISRKKYEDQEFYTATLIPEYGSWIRFTFRKFPSLSMSSLIYKNQIILQLDKLTQKSILSFFKEIGVTNQELQNSLEHSDFFYHFYQKTNNLNLNQKLNFSILRTQLDSKNDKSEFSKIFDPIYYKLGRIGRFKINKRLKLKISQRIQVITYEDLFAIIDYLLTLSISKLFEDDIDHLKNRRVRSVGELLQNLFRIGFQRIARKLRGQTNQSESKQISNFNILNSTIREFFGSSQLSQYMDQTNPLSSITHKRRISALGPGGLNRDRISFKVRDIHPSHYGRICPIETPEGQNVGLIASLTTCARINKLGFIETPFWRVINGKIFKTSTPIYLTAEMEDHYKIAPADYTINEKNYLSKTFISVRFNQEFINVSPFNVDFVAILPIQIVSVATSLIPFFEHDDANRALMGSNMQRQSVPLLLPQKPIVGTGLENQIAIDSGMALIAEKSGIIKHVTAEYIVLQEKSGKLLKYFLQKYVRSNQETCINQRPIVWQGDIIKSGQILSDGPGINQSELALGQNLLVAYMPWQGYNFEDAILINEHLIYNDNFTSIHIEKYTITVNQNEDSFEEITKNLPNLTTNKIEQLNDEGIIKIGTFVKSGDILVGKVGTKNDSEQLPETKLLRAIFGSKAKGVRDTSYRMPEGKSGRVIDKLIFNKKTKTSYQYDKVQIFIAEIRKIQVGDKIAGRHGNKGIISRILSRQDMPFLPDGTPIDILLNPLGVPSRMNVGQLYECLLGLAGHKLNRRFKILPFDEMHGPEISRILVNKKLRQASIENNEAWLFNPYCPGKMVLIDGITGNEFDNPITVGNAYILKLIHLVDDKMHSRATGPYSLITQQPLGGKAQQGGQRFGEMEVWALEGFGAAFTLKELLTVKSDDMEGRNKTLNAIVKGKKIPLAGIPESFKVLLQELRSIGLDLSTYKIEEFNQLTKYDKEINLIETYDAINKAFITLAPKKFN